MATSYAVRISDQRRETQGVRLRYTTGKRLTNVVGTRVKAAMKVGAASA
jgi:hypothetical protein